MASNSFVFTEKASKDLEEILNYISVELANFMAAKLLFENIEKTVNLLCVFPESGNAVKNEYIIGQNVRKIAVNNYLLYYLYDSIKKCIIILRIVYVRRNKEKNIDKITIDALNTFDKARDISEANDNSEMTLDEINEEIRFARLKKKKN